MEIKKSGLKHMYAYCFIALKQLYQTVNPNRLIDDRKDWNFI